MLSKELKVLLEQRIGARMQRAAAYQFAASIAPRITNANAQTLFYRFQKLGIGLDFDEKQARALHLDVHSLLFGSSLVAYELHIPDDAPNPDWSGGITPDAARDYEELATNPKYIGAIEDLIEQEDGNVKEFLLYLGEYAYQNFIGSLSEIKQSHQERVSADLSQPFYWNVIGAFFFGMYQRDPDTYSELVRRRS